MCVHIERIREVLKIFICLCDFYIVTLNYSEVTLKYISSPHNITSNRSQKEKRFFFCSILIHCFLHAPNYFVCIPIAEFFTSIKFWSTLRDLHLRKTVMQCRQSAHHVPRRTLCFTCIVSLKLSNPVQRSCVVNPIVQMRKLRFRELNSFAQLRMMVLQFESTSP